MKHQKINKIKLLKEKFKRYWHNAICLQTFKLKNKGYSFKKIVGDYIILSFICLGLLLIIILLIVLLILSFVLW